MITAKVFFNPQAFARGQKADYFLGFIASYALLRTRLDLNFKPALLPVVENFCRFLSLNRRPRRCDAGWSPIYKLAFDPRALRQTFNALGIFSGRLAPRLARSQNFWRGYFEGRGSVYFSAKYPVVRILFKRPELADAFFKFSGVRASARVLAAGGSTAVAIGKKLRGRPVSARLGSKLQDLARWKPSYRARAETWKPDQLNHHAFSRPSPDALYWAGFLMADGWTDGKRAVGVKLAARDAGHLKKLRSFVRSSRPVRLFDNRGFGRVFPACRLVFSSPEICRDLARHGVVPRKSAKERAGAEAAGSPDFWRGVVDGDGTVALYPCRGREYPNLKFCGSKELCAQWNTFAAARELKPAKPQRSGSPRLWSVHYNGEPARKAIELLYRNAGTALDRKRASAARCLQWASGRAARGTS